MNALPQVVVDLLAAREVLAVRGLAKGTFENLDGTVCARGALLVAIAGSVWAPSDCKWDREAAASRFASAIVGRYIASFNNANRTTKNQVLRVLDDAASLALSEAAARGEYR